MRAFSARTNTTSYVPSGTSGGSAQGGNTTGGTSSSTSGGSASGGTLATGGQPATWDAGGESTEYSDCFMTFDGGSNPGDLGENYEGSNFNGGGDAAMPEDIEAAIKAALVPGGRLYIDGGNPLEEVEL